MYYFNFNKTMSNITKKSIIITTFIITLMISYLILYSSKPKMVEEDIKIQQAGNLAPEVSKVKVVKYSIIISVIISVLVAIYVFAKY